MTSYIIRLDDLSRFSDLAVWKDIVDCCRSNGIKCLIGVIPSCDDKKLKKKYVSSDVEFWAFVKSCSDMDIAIHGFKHELFGGNTYNTQYRLMAESMKVFASKMIIPDCFIAPKHIYDENTIHAMRDLGISFLSDGVGVYPWRRMDYDIIQVPQMFWKPRSIPFVPFGVITFCQHPDTMTGGDITNLKKFIENNKNAILSIYDVILTPLEYFNFIIEPIYHILYKLKFGFKKR